MQIFKFEDKVEKNVNTLEKTNKQPNKRKLKQFTRGLYLCSGSAIGIIAAKIVSWLLHALLS